MFESLFQAYKDAKDNISRRMAHRVLLRRLRHERTLVLVPGHYKRAIGNDPGACANQTNEHLEVVNICNRAWEILQRDDFNAIVIPEGLLLKEKIAWINKNFPKCVLLSVHMNAGRNDVRGVESWYLSYNRKMRECADEASKIMNRYTGIKIRDSKGDLTNHHGSLGILRCTKPVDELLIEIGFITNKDDLTRARLSGGEAVAEVAKMLYYS